MNPTTALNHALPTTRTKTRSSLACLACRSKHLKCNGMRPLCNRCAEANRQCDYAQSRRGGLDRAALAERRKRLAAEIQAPEVTPKRNQPRSIIGDEQGLIDGGNLPNTEYRSMYSSSPQERVQITIESDPLIESYYKNFHGCHPFLLPRRHLARLYRDPDKQSGLKPLVAILRLIGYIYDSQEWSIPLKTHIDASFLEATKGDPIMVQCRLLYSTALFWYDYKDDAMQEMDAAVRLALDLQMFRREFAIEHGAQDPVLTECWRRTWWTVYILDGYFAGTLGTRGTLKSAVFGVETTVELPCEEFEYESGEIPEPRTLADFDCRDLALDDLLFSSFAYLIGAVRCGSFAMSMVPKSPTREQSTHVLQAADSIINGWLQLLPKNRKQVMNKAGDIDELMFQAHLLIHTVIIAVHRPLSDLKFNPIEHISSCSRDTPAEITSPELINVHTVRVLRSVEAQIRLLALPVQRFHHSPFATCMVSVGTLALLSACSSMLNGTELAIARDQIRMTIGCLKSLGELWPRTARNLQEIQTIARHVLGMLGSRTTTTSGSTPNSNSVPSLSSGHGETGLGLGTDSSSSEEDVQLSVDLFGDLCGWYSLNDLGQDFSWWTNGQEI